MASKSRSSHRRWSDTFKKRVVAEASQPGVTISQIAHRYDVDAWRLATTTHVQNYLRRRELGRHPLPKLANPTRKRGVSH
jgi:transposase-like protein